MEAMRIIYKMLRYLEKMMRVEEPDYTPIMPEALGMQSMPETEKRYFNYAKEAKLTDDNGSFQKELIEPLAVMAPLVEFMRW